MNREFKLRLGKSLNRFFPIPVPTGVTLTRQMLRRVARYLPTEGIRFRPDRTTWLLTSIAGLGALLALTRTLTFGVGLTWDSVNYIAVARGLAAGDGFMQFHTEDAYTQWPPLYPLLLATFARVGLDPHLAAAPLNALLFGLTIWVIGRWWRARLESSFLTVWGCLAVMLALPLAQLAAYAMTTVPFILWTSLALSHADRFLQDRRRGALGWAAFFTALACVTRYLGVALLVSVALLLLLQHRAALWIRIRHSAVFVLVAVLPLSAWLLRNYRITGLITGSRDFDPSLVFNSRIVNPDDYSVVSVMESLFSVIYRWAFSNVYWWALPETAWLSPMIPLRLEPNASVWIGSGVGLILGAAAVTVAYVCLRRPPQPETWQSRTAFCLNGAFAFMYIGVLVAAITQQLTWHGFQSRFAAPLYIPLLYLFVCLLDRGGFHVREAAYAGRIQARAALTVRSLGISFLSLWVIGLAASNVQEILRFNRIGMGTFSTWYWFQSETLAYARQNPATGTLYSNTASHVYIYAGASAKDYEDMPYDAVQWQIELQSARDGDMVYWFYELDTQHFFEYDATALLAMPELEPVARLSDGLVLRVHRDRAPDSDYDYMERIKAVHAKMAQSERIIRSVFDVYLWENEIVLSKEPCAREDVQARFVLHVFPVDPSVLSAARRPFGFDNLGFTFTQAGLRVHNKCLATVQLPSYAIDRFYVGQFDSSAQRDLWQDGFQYPDALARRYEAVLSGSAVVRSVFDVYVTPNAVAFAKEPCRPDDTKAKFIVHVVPQNRWTLPWRRWPYGFDNLSFYFEHHGARVGDQCLATAQLPLYGIQQIRVGQYDADAQRHVWQEAFAP